MPAANSAGFIHYFPEEASASPGKAVSTSAEGDDGDSWITVPVKKNDHQDQASAKETTVNTDWSVPQKFDEKEPEGLDAYEDSWGTSFAVDPSTFETKKNKGQYRRQPQLPATLKIKEYFSEADSALNTDSWLSRPEIPDSQEVFASAEDESSGDEDGAPPLLGNKVVGPYAGKEEYLSTHYELLREDSVRPLREVIFQIKQMPAADEFEFMGAAMGVYSGVRVTAVTFGVKEMAVRVAFSYSRIKKRVRWENSRRLIAGTLVALTPEQDMFQSKCVIAVVAARPLALVQQSPPEIDLYFAKPEEMQLDPHIEWVMVEERATYFEAARHSLRALQKMMREPFPLSEYLVDVTQEIEPPAYLMKNPVMEMAAAFGEWPDDAPRTVNILKDWPSSPISGLDESQMLALQTILTKRLAIVQGPPGTGKTYVSVIAIRAMLSKMTKGDPPIVVACQTNHALDQLLRHIATFEPDFIRLGGRSKEVGIIKSRTLYEVGRAMQETPVPSATLKSALRNMRSQTEKMAELLEVIEQGNDAITQDLFSRLGLLTAAQCLSLERHAEDWVDHTKEHSNSSPISLWLGDSLVPVQQTITADDLGFEFEEEELDAEELQEIEAEAAAKEDDDWESLRGRTVRLGETFTGRKTSNISEKKIEQLLSQQQDLTKVNQRDRGPIYTYLLKKSKEIAIDKFRAATKVYNSFAKERQIGQWEKQHGILRQQKVVGMTTTGLSKYRALISSLSPKIVLIEEAAETFEAPVTAACFPSLEHLILVGDHQQLRPRCNVLDFSSDPFFLDMSLFERMINNEVDFSILQLQRRMIPEIRRLVIPIYGDLIQDHPSVQDDAVRPPIPGMGGINSFFFTHEWDESFDEQASFCNRREADMLLGLYKYLLANGVSEESVTILTFYNGQRRLLLRMLRSDGYTSRRICKVCTIDSYQGEENDIVLLSLVRSNTEFSIGFTSHTNRVCVALSRARRGLYLFGNGQMLASAGSIWAKVITILAGRKGNAPKTGKKQRVGYAIPLYCAKHDRKTWVLEPEDWSNINGGCDKPCRETLPCRHVCLLKCHLSPHDEIQCRTKCDKLLPCSHECGMYCFQACVCTECGRATPKRPSPGQGQDAPNSTAPLSTESSATALSDDEFRRDTEVVHRFAAARETARPERYTSQPGGRGGDRKTAKNRGMVIKIGDPSAHESARPLSGGAVASPTKLIIDNIIDTPIELAPSRRFDDVDLLEFQDSLDSKTDSKKTLATRPKGSTAAVQPGLPEPLLPTILFNRKEQVEERDSVNLLD